MNITGIYGYQNTLVQQLGVQRGQMDDLEQQLATGLTSQTFGGLGPDRSQALSFQTQLDTAQTYQSAIGMIETRLSLMNTSIQRISDINSSMKTQFSQNTYNLLSSGVTDQQQSALNGMDEVLSLFSSSAGGPYVFGGKSTSQSPVAATDAILDGTGGQAGLKQVISERLQADQGSNGLGRLTVGASAGVVTVAEDGVHPFGLKLTGVTSSLAGATTTQPTGTPPAESVDFTSGLPNSGDKVTFAYKLPDGTTGSVALTATTASPAPSGSFTIGADAVTTATNLSTALTSALTTVGQTDLVAASAIAASGNFFNTYQGQAPQRVSGPPFNTATALVDGTAANTVSWYTGDQSATNPRLDATTRVDARISVNYGVRANEPAFSWQMQQLAVAAAFDASSGTASTKAAYLALTSRVQANLATPPANAQITSVQTEIASAYTTADQAKTRHTAEIGTYQTLLGKVENTDQTTAIAQLSSLQTQMQASYQASAILLKLSLATYITA